MKKTLLSIALAGFTTIVAASASITPVAAKTINSPVAPAVISAISTSADVNSVITTGSMETVFWNTENFPAAAQLNVNLIQKVSDSPVSYQLVRQVATNVQNTGSATWTPDRTEIKNNLIVEVTCANPSQFVNGCSAKVDQNIFAVRGNFTDNVANVWDAFMSLFK